MKVVAINDDGTTTDPLPVHERSLIAHEMGGVPVGGKKFVAGILYERVED